MSNNKLVEVIDLGRQPLGNGFLLPEEFKNEYFFNMKVGFDEESKLLQLIEQPEPEKMFHDNYAFFSSTSRLMAVHFKEWADSIKSSRQNDNPKILEIGCNDGIFIQNFLNTNFSCLGLEPSKNVGDEAKKKGVEVINRFVTIDAAHDIVNDKGKFDYITAANVICHIPNILDLAEFVRLVLKEDGQFSFEEPYLGDIVEKCSYDQIYDEHVFLFSCLSIKYLFNKVGLDLINAEHQNTHGGSMRYTIGNPEIHKPTQAVEKIINREVEMGLDKCETMFELSKKIKKSKDELISCLTTLKDKGHRVCGYAATSKSTTILNYCKIDANLIECIYDTTPLKQGKYSPGMHIPIIDWKEFNEDMPDYSFLFAWNHLKEIMAKEEKYTKSGRNWITHIPQVSIL